MAFSMLHSNYIMYNNFIMYGNYIMYNYKSHNHAYYIIEQLQLYLL